MCRRIALVFGTPALVAFVACGGRTDDSTLDLAMAGAPSTGGSGGAGAASGGGGGSTSGGSGGATSGSGGGNTGGSTGGSGLVACLPGTYDTDVTDSELTCESWSECPPGQRFVDFGLSDRDTVCADCEDGTFTAESNSGECEEWSTCTFGEQEETPPSPANDRVCTAAEVFPKYEVYGDPGPLAVTSAGAHLAVGGEGQEAQIVSYSLNGASVSDWFDNSSVNGMPDLTYIGSDLYLAGWGYVWAEGVEGGISAGFVRKFDQNANLLWSHLFADEALETPLSVRVTAREGAVYVVANSLIYDCPVVDGGLDCTGIEHPSWRELGLSVLDPAGDVSLSVLLEQETDVTEILDVAVASDQHVFVAVRRELADPDLETVERIIEFDETGAFVDEHEVQGLLHHLSADEVGNVYAIGQQLYRLGSFGEFESRALELDEGDGIHAFTATEEGLLLLGRGTTEAVLYAVDPSGDVLSREALASPWDVSDTVFTGVQQTADGTVYFGGESGGAVFVTTWP